MKYQLSITHYVIPWGQNVCDIMQYLHSDGSCLRQNVFWNGIRRRFKCLYGCQMKKNASVMIFLAAKLTGGNINA